jgi:arsenate reductase
MAEGLLSDAGGETFEVVSAGIDPSFVRLEAIEAMSEIGIDISSHRSKSIDEFIGQPFDYVIPFAITRTSNARCSRVNRGGFTGA